MRRGARSTLLGALPESFPAALCVVLHTSPDSPRVLVDILRSKTRLAVKYAENDESIQTGSVYVAPPNWHLLVRDSRLGLGRGPRENRHRPAADPLFRTAALAYGSRTIGVILTGNLDDGSRGLMAVKQAGGVAIVQDPADAPFPGMPQAALNSVAVDYTVRLSEIAPLLGRLVEEDLPGKSEQSTAALERDSKDSGVYTCPECGGPLSEFNGDRVPYYRCRVGHAYSPQSMLGAQQELVENSLWAAVVSLQQQAEINRRLAHDARQAGRKHSAPHFQDRAKNAARHAEVVQSMLTSSAEGWP